jgi:transposase
MLLAARGYDADWIRTLVREHGAWANIPPKSNPKEALSFSPYLCRARNLVERFFNKIKHCRRVAARCDKLAANYLAFIQLASIRLWLRINECTAWSGAPDWGIDWLCHPPLATAALDPWATCRNALLDQLSGLELMRRRRIAGSSQVKPGDDASGCGDVVPHHFDQNL